MTVKIDNTQRAVIARLARKNNISPKDLINMLFSPEGRKALSELK